LTEASFDRLAVVGLGLLGGSIALAARERGVASEIRVVDPYASGVSDFALVRLADAARWADGIVVAAPASAVDEIFRELAEHVSPEVLITDTVSVKRPVAEAARRRLRHPERCVGAHPMAGSEHSGFAFAASTLFVDAPCLLALEGHEDPADVERIERFWQRLGARTSRHTPDEHDAIVAVLSHAPHLVAFAFARGLTDPSVLEWAGPGLRDFVRIARASPELWTDILRANRDHVIREAEHFQQNFDALLGALVDDDAARLRDAIDAGRCAVEKL